MLTTSPTRPAASAPASTAARTAATSPRRVMDTRPLPTLCCSTNSTLAALSAASQASTAATMPLVSINPIASPFAINDLLRVVVQTFSLHVQVENLHYNFNASTVCRATISSSFVGTIQICERERSLLIFISPPRELFFSESNSIPAQVRLRQM